MFEPADVLDGLNDDQRRAATHQSGPLLVLAGAGTGKTRTLVARAGWLRSQGTPASRILLLTFTRRAADDMLARVTPRGASAADRVIGGTFHAVAHQIIRAHAEAFSLPPEFSVIDPPDVTNLMDTLRAENGLVTSQRRAPRAGTCADIYTRCVNTRAPVPEVIKAQFPWVAGFETELAGLFRAYTAHKRQHGLVDFDDLLLLWRAALADAAAGPVLRGMFDAVLVDEYQDVNAIQADIVRLLRPGGPGLTCVGDDAQAIYAFRGADPAHLRALAADYPDLEVIRLARNYRSKDAVLRLANTVRPQSEGLELALRAERGTGARPQLVRCHDEATQAREICGRVLEAREAGADLRDQAVLMRAATHSDVLEIELSVRRIPFIKYGGIRFTEAAHVKDFMAAARVVTNPADDLAWFRLLRLHEGIGPVHARRFIGALGLGDPQLWQHWKAAVDVLPPRARPAVADTMSCLADAAGRERTADRAAGILTALDSPLRERYPDAGIRLADLQRLVDAAATRPSLHDALVELALDPPVSASDLAGPPRLDDDYLVLSTIHSAKGLEWPVVHLLQLVDGAVPSDMALASRAGLEEERRLFYVAVTRARDQLYLYAPLRMHHHRMASDDRHGYGQLTRFLDPAALAECDAVDATPPEPVLPKIGPLAATIDAALDSLFGPA
ncbi:MAG TPA: ATP-dependent helicase [Streptosporangiaceae bacterium]|nr:ATP-dependent helicase [Streptosporangiaceae bacterium]